MSWAEISIADIGRIVTGDTPPKKNPAFYGNAYPFIKPTDMTVGQRITTNYEAGYSLEGFQKYRNKLIRAGSTAVVTIGSIGQKLTFLQNDGFVNQAVNAIIPNTDKFNDLYVYYLLKHNLGLVKQADTGASSGRENVSKSNFSALKVWACLDRNEQIRITTILDGFDSLLEVNQSRIALLEESARLLYREWFVKLHFPGHELAKVVNGVPERWELKPVSDFASLLSRGITPKYDDLSKGLIINQKCIREGRLNLAPARHQSKQVKQDKLVQIGDILINSTGAGTLGRVAQLRCEIADCTVDTHVTIVRPKLAKAIGFLGVALLELAPVFESMGRGATNQLELGRADIANLKLLTPPEQLQVDFHNIVWTTFEQVQVLIDSCNLLSETRDALLPKLMSGQLAV